MVPTLWFLLSMTEAKTHVLGQKDFLIFIKPLIGKRFLKTKSDTFIGSENLLSASVP